MRESSNVGVSAAAFSPQCANLTLTTQGEGRTLADFRRCYNSTADRTLSPGGFYQRLTPTLAEYFSDLVETALDEVAVPDTAGASVLV